MMTSSVREFSMDEPVLSNNIALTGGDAQNKRNRQQQSVGTWKEEKFRKIISIFNFSVF